MKACAAFRRVGRYSVHLFYARRFLLVLQDVSACDVDQIQADVNQLPGDVLLKDRIETARMLHGNVRTRPGDTLLSAHNRQEMTRGDGDLSIRTFLIFWK